MRRNKQSSDPQHDGEGNSLPGTPLFRLESALSDGDTPEVFVGDLRDVLAICPEDDVTKKLNKAVATGTSGSKVSVSSADLEKVCDLVLNQK